MICTDILCNELSPVNSTTNFTTPVLFSGEAIYFRRIFNNLHSKEENGPSKFSGFFLCKTNIPKPANDNNKHGKIWFSVYQYYYRLLFCSE
jgi:hypothetical protein